MDINGQIWSLGQCLRGRIPDDIIEDALEYLDHNEWGLSFELFCSNICDFRVPLSFDEFSLIQEIDRKCCFVLTPEYRSNLSMLCNSIN